MLFKNLQNGQLQLVVTCNNLSLSDSITSSHALYITTLGNDKYKQLKSLPNRSTLFQLITEQFYSTRQFCHCCRLLSSRWNRILRARLYEGPKVTQVRKLGAHSPPTSYSLWHFINTKRDHTMNLDLRLHTRKSIFFILLRTTPASSLPYFYFQML